MAAGPGLRDGRAASGASRNAACRGLGGLRASPCRRLGPAGLFLGRGGPGTASPHACCVGFIPRVSSQGTNRRPIWVFQRRRGQRLLCRSVQGSLSRGETSGSASSSRRRGDNTLSGSFSLSAGTALSWSTSSSHISSGSFGRVRDGESPETEHSCVSRSGCAISALLSVYLSFRVPDKSIPGRRVVRDRAQFGQELVKRHKFWALWCLFCGVFAHAARAVRHRGACSWLQAGAWWIPGPHGAVFGIQGGEDGSKHHIIDFVFQLLQLLFLFFFVDNALKRRHPLGTAACHAQFVGLADKFPSPLGIHSTTWCLSRWT